LAWLVRLRVLPSLSFLASAMYRAINALSWGEHRGGMFVRVAGVDADGAPVARSWHLIAEHDAGPFIPSMAAEAIMREGVRGKWPATGARPALRELEVSDYEPLLARREIDFGVRDDSPASLHDLPLYQRILGPAWHALPATLRAVHSVSVLPPAVASATANAAARSIASAGGGLISDATGRTATMTASGRADVTRGTGWLAALVASLVGFPRAGKDVSVEVRFDITASPSGGSAREAAPGGLRETWTRTFAGRSFSSEQFAGAGRFDRLVCERFGPITLVLALIVEECRLRLVVRGWSFLGIPLPSTLAPHCDADEFEHDGRFHFDVAIAHRWTGLIVHYSGWLLPKAVR
jgi:hypothetical protein